MSNSEYIKYYKYLDDNQKDAMSDLWMSGINLEGHVYVTYDNVEKTVAKLIKEWKKTCRTKK